MRKFLITAALIAPLFNPIAASAYQTEVDPQEVAHKNRDSIERRIREERQARRAAREAAAVAAAYEAIDYSTPLPGPVISDGIDWDAIAWCESRGDWDYNGPSGYDGGLQFLPSTWTGAGGGKYAPYAWQATREEQIAVASTLSLSNWPHCQRYA